MDIRPIGRDDIEQSFDTPSYRVCFWRHSAPPRRGASAAWYELAGEVNVRQAFAWADENAGAGRTYTLYAVFDMPWPGRTETDVATRRVMVRLFGVDPTKNPELQPRWPSEIYG